MQDSRNTFSTSLYAANGDITEHHKPHLTLHKLLNAVNEFKLRLRMMAVLADACVGTFFCPLYDGVGTLF